MKPLAGMSRAEMTALLISHLGQQFERGNHTVNFAELLVAHEGKITVGALLIRLAGKEQALRLQVMRDHGVDTSGGMSACIKPEVKFGVGIMEPDGSFSGSAGPFDHIHEANEYCPPDGVTNAVIAMLEPGGRTKVLYRWVADTGQWMKAIK